MDKAHGILHYIHRSFDENMEVKCKTKFQNKMNKKLIFRINQISISFHRVSLTYRVKSAHKVKLTDKQLLQWMVPILLVMLIYLGTWTLSATPCAEVVSFAFCSSYFFHGISFEFVVFILFYETFSLYFLNFLFFFSDRRFEWSKV